jgi:hypothetical protein
MHHLAFRVFHHSGVAEEITELAERPPALHNAWLDATGSPAAGAPEEAFPAFAGIRDSLIMARINTPIL